MATDEPTVKESELEKKLKELRKELAEKDKKLAELDADIKGHAPLPPKERERLFKASLKRQEEKNQLMKEMRDISSISKRMRRVRYWKKIIHVQNEA